MGFLVGIEIVPKSTEEAFDQHHCFRVYTADSWSMGLKYGWRKLQPIMQHWIPERMAEVSGLNFTEH